MVGVSNLKNQDDIGQHLERLRADVITLSETVARLASESAAGAQLQLSETATRTAQKVSAAGAEGK